MRVAGMSDGSDTEARIEALEIHVAHQAQVIEDLHTSLAAQWTTIDGLRRHLAAIADRLETAETQAGLPLAQRPPHY